MARTTDQNELRLIGANPYMIVHEDPKGPPMTHVSIWRIEVSPAGAGHTLFWYSELTNGESRIYADNISLARWLQDDIVRENMPYKDMSLPVHQARFTWTGAVPLPVMAQVEAEGAFMQFTWYDFLPAFSGTQTPEAGETHGHLACYVPAQGVRVTLNGAEARGGPLHRDRDGYPHTTCFLALNESWTRVRSAKQ
jgi:hypothetical protein